MNIENLQELWKSLTSPKVAAVTCIISGFILFTSPKFLEYMQLVQVRAEYLSTVSIIFITSCAFSIDPKIIEDKCGMPAFNLGLPVSAGPKYLLYQALEKTRPGDILVVALPQAG